MPTRCRKSEEEDAGRRGVDELAAGFDQHVTKPVDATMLDELLGRPSS